MIDKKGENLKGHPIEHNGIEFVFSDTKESTAKTYESRGCGNCGSMPTEEGHDACMGTLGGVANACCGHGYSGEAFVQLLDGTMITGKNAIVVQKILVEERGKQEGYKKCWFGDPEKLEELRKNLK